MVTAARKIWYAKNAERLRREAQEYRLNNLETYRNRDKVRQSKIRLEAIDHYSNNTRACALCPESRIAALTIDHINGGGRQERKRLKLPGGWVFCCWLQKSNFPPGYRVLCSNCNWLEYLCSIDPPSSTNAIQLKNWKTKTKMAIMDLLGGKCRTCYLTDIRLLTVHHSKNNGAEHRRSVGHNQGSTAFYRSVLKTGDVKDLECLCFSCNDVLAWGNADAKDPRQR